MIWGYPYFWKHPQVERQQTFVAMEWQLRNLRGRVVSGALCVVCEAWTAGSISKEGELCWFKIYFWDPKKGAFSHGNRESTHKFVASNHQIRMIILSWNPWNGKDWKGFPQIATAQELHPGELRVFELRRELRQMGRDDAGEKKGNRVDFGEDFNQYELTFWGFAMVSMVILNKRCDIQDGKNVQLDAHCI